MRVEFTHFTKDRKSTARPPQILWDNAWTYEVVLKDASSIFSPVIVLEGWSTIDNLNQHLYARIPDFGRSYFVEEIIYDGPVVVFYLSCDVMGTFADDIKILNVFATRAQTDYDPYYIDTYVQPRGARQQHLVEFASPYTPNYTDGFYVVGIINNDENQVGAVSYYVFTHDGFKFFCAKIFGTGDYAGLDESSLDLATFRAVFNPMQYISSCMYIPQTNVGGFTDTPVTQLAFGWYKIDDMRNCWRLKMQTNAGYKVTIPRFDHPAINETQQYLNIDPYMQITLIFPPFGEIPIDTTKCMEDNVFILRMSTDPISGVATLYIWSAENEDADSSTWHFLYKALVKLGEEVQLAQVSKDNYAIQTAIAQRDANVINAIYGLDTTDIVVGALTGTAKYISQKTQQLSLWEQIKQHYGNMWIGAEYPDSNNGVSLGGIVSSAVNGALNPPKVTANVNAAKAAGAESIVKAQQPQVTKQGNSSGGVSQYVYPNMIVYDYYMPSERNIKGNGYPLMRNVFVASVSGYLQCGNVVFAKHELPRCTPVEREYIKTVLEAGCYIE